jgi:surface polysaccharide O-acyltransferase-like enzyme
MIEDQVNAAPATGRNGAVDFLKATAILGVLTIHASFGGYDNPVGSFNWLSAVFWGSLARPAVPVFLMCSGALMLDPRKELTTRSLFRKNLLRILVALFFWASAYQFSRLLVSGGGITAQALVRALKDVILFRHEFHLYYLHIMLLVYLCLPVTRVFTAHAARQQYRYLLGVWFVLGIVYPIALKFWPFTLLAGIPPQYSVNMGYGLAGYYIKQLSALKFRTCVLLFAGGFAIVFGGTLTMSLNQGALYQLFWEGMSPGVALMAVGLFGMAVSRFRDAKPPGWTERLSRASFCIYLVHIFFLDALVSHSFTVRLLPCLVSIPLTVAAVFLCSCLTYLVLSRIPFVRNYLI